MKAAQQRVYMVESRSFQWSEPVPGMCKHAAELKDGAFSHTFDGTQCQACRHAACYRHEIPEVCPDCGHGQEFRITCCNCKQVVGVAVENVAEAIEQHETVGCFVSVMAEQVNVSLPWGAANPDKLIGDGAIVFDELVAWDAPPSGITFSELSSVYKMICDNSISPGLHTWPGANDDNNRRMFETCVVLEKHGYIKRQINEVNHVFWVPVEGQSVAFVGTVPNDGCVVWSAGGPTRLAGKPVEKGPFAMNREELESWRNEGGRHITGNAGADMGHRKEVVPEFKHGDTVGAGFLIDDIPVLPIPRACARWSHEKRGGCGGRIVERDGVMKCEWCNVSYGPVDND